MSVRQGLLALLADRPMHGYQLRQEFEARTGSTWPLNIGQVYTTLQRLERDGLVREIEMSKDGTVPYCITDEGLAHVNGWWFTPVDRSKPARDELAIKLSLAVTAKGVNVREIVQRQRLETQRALEYFKRLAYEDARPDATGRELAWPLVLDALVGQAQAELEWLDRVQERIAVSKNQTTPVHSTLNAAHLDQHARASLQQR